MGLVSSLYRMVPSEAPVHRDESDRRLKVKIRRLIAEHGRDEVVRRLREADISQEQMLPRAWLVLAAAGEPDPRERHVTESAH